MSTQNPPTKPSTPKSAGVTSKLVSWISTTELSSVPPEVQTRAKHLILDGLACALVGAHLPWSETATNAILAIEPPGASTLIGWGPEHKLSPMATTLLNSTYIQGFELDDVNTTSPLHNNSLFLPALLGASHLPSPSNTNPSPPPTGSSFLLAYIIGCETGPRIGLSLGGPDLLTRGWHSGTLMGPAAVAAALSSLFSLSPPQIDSALGTACTQAGGLMAAQFGSMAKRMQHGFAARNGLLAAVLARSGYTGIEDVFDQKYGGFLSCFGQGMQPPGAKPDEVVKELGERWEVMNIKVKFHAAMAGLHGTIDCIAALQEKHPERFADVSTIKGIESHVGEAAFGHGGWIMPEGEKLTSVAAQMSIQYAAAAQCVDGEVMMGQFGEEKLNRTEVVELMRKVKPVLEESFTGATGWSTRVVVTFHDGRTVEETVGKPRFIDPGVSNAEIVAKWRRLVGGLGLESERIERIERLVLNMENEGEGVIEKLAALLEGSVGKAI
jgi:aconitate decarboxylase